jgi:hypothetical protein
MIDTCVCCGSYVPEGRQVCKKCEYAQEEITNNLNAAWPTHKHTWRPVEGTELAMAKKIVTIIVWTPVLIAVCIGAIIITPMKCLFELMTAGESGRWDS